MGRLIDEAEIYKRLRPILNNGDLDDVMLDLPTVEAIPKADYENRLKADLVAMLEEIQYEASNICPTIRNCCSFTEGIMAYDKFIQQKIKDLKEQEDGKDN